MSQTNIEDILNSKSNYGPTLEQYIKRYAKQNKELPNIETLRSAGFAESKHNLRISLSIAAKQLELPLPEIDNVDTIVNSSTSVSDGENIVKFCKALYNILQNYSKRHIVLLQLLSDGKPKSIKYLTSELSISRPTLYSWIKILKEHISIKKVTLESDGPGRPPRGYVLDLDESNIVKFCKALYNILQNSDDTNSETISKNETNLVSDSVTPGSIPKNGITPFEEWITLPFEVPEEWKPILTLIVGTSIAEQHVQVKEQLHGLSIKKAIVSAYHQAVKDLEKKISDIAQVNGHQYFELCGGVPAAFFDKYMMHETLGCVGDLEGKIEEVEEHVYLRKRRL